MESILRSLDGATSSVSIVERIPAEHGSVPRTNSSVRH